MGCVLLGKWHSKLFACASRNNIIFLENYTIEEDRIKTVFTYIISKLFVRFTYDLQFSKTAHFFDQKISKT